MFLFLKKKDEDGPPETPSPRGVPRGGLHEFIPYHSHWDAHTLLTKNGELMQTLRITGNRQGLHYEGSQPGTVRDVIRAALAEAIPDERFSVWVHTLRRRQPMSDEAPSGRGFAAEVYAQWRRTHRFRHQYRNEVYVSVLHEGQPAELIDRKSLGHVLLAGPNRHYRHAYLESAHERLEATVESVLLSLRRDYEVQRLGVAERDAGGVQAFYSEPMEFISHLLNLRDGPVFLPQADISRTLDDGGLTFGFNAIEARGGDTRRFGALLSLKQYEELPAETMDRILQAPIEMTISQSFHFAPASQVLREYREQRSLLETSGDEWSLEATGVAAMLAENRKQPTDFGEHQTGIMVIVDDYKSLDAETARAQNAFGELGLITIREDIRIEEAFWAQLPGNFEFIRRREPIAASRIGGFARLNRFPAGNAQGNPWGSAVCLLPTQVQSPYFFNFHHEGNGHTLLADFNAFGDQAASQLLHFLLTCSLKYRPRLFIFDRGQSARLLMGRIGGAYHRFSPVANGLRLNPFALEGTDRNLGFLNAWCASVAETSAPLGAAQKTRLREALHRLFSGPASGRHLPGLVAQLGDPELAAAFAPLSGLLDAAADGLDLTKDLHGFDMDTVANTPAAVPLFSCLLNRIIDSLDGRPAIILLREAHELLDNDFFAPRLESLLEMLKQNNVALIASSTAAPQWAATPGGAAFLAGAATRLALPDDIEVDYAASGIGLDESGARMLKNMERGRGDFLLAQGRESVALRLDLAGLGDLDSIFAGDIKTLIAAGGKLGGATLKGTP